MEASDDRGVLQSIHDMATEALRQPGITPAVEQALRKIAELAQRDPGDTRELSDPPHTDNQSL